jgi:protein TonB
MAAIIGLHMLAVAMGLAIKGPSADLLPEAQPIQVTLNLEPRAVVPQRSEVKVKLQDPSMPQPITPVIQITLPEEAPTATITLASTPAPAQVAVEQSGEDPVSVTDPDYLQMPRPVYPLAAKRARAQGLVHVRALVDVEGRAQEATVARSSGFELLDHAACEAVRRALFKPYRRNNIARSMVVIVPVEFSLTPHMASRL